MQGRLDSNLTKVGIEQAKQLQKRLCNIRFDAVIYSPSSRTTETARLLLPHSAVQTPDVRLLEMHLGPWQGMTEEAIKSHHHDAFYDYYQQPDMFQLPDGESFLDVRVRMETWLKELEQTYRQGNLLIVTHGIVTKTLLQVAQTQPISDFWLTPMVEGCSLTVLQFDQRKWNVALAGCTEHFRHGFVNR